MSVLALYPHSVTAQEPVEPEAVCGPHLILPTEALGWDTELSIPRTIICDKEHEREMVGGR